MAKQLNLYIDEEVDSMFRELAKEDIRSLNNQFEWLVREEHGRRKQERGENEVECVEVEG